MKFNGRYKVESNRLIDWDYGTPWWYYVTICTKGMNCYFGEIKNESMSFNDIGNIACKFWTEIPNHHKNIELDEFVIMPNHLHGIVILNDVSRDVQLNVSTERIKNNKFSEISPLKHSLSVVIRTYKGAVTKWCKKNGYEYFNWQRNYYDHIIRNQADLDRIRKYINLNPLKWEIDKYYIK